MQSLVLSRLQSMSYEEQVVFLRAVLAGLSDMELGTAIELARQEQVKRAPVGPLPDKLFR